MSSALDTFERSLVAASRELAATTAVEATDAAPSPGARETCRRRRRGPLRRLRSLGLVARAGVALAMLLACGGIAGAAYVVLAGGTARLLPAFECQIGDGSLNAIIPAVTGSPLVDCAAAWPSASGGRQMAPPLAIWGAGNGQRLVAVVAPVSAGVPAGNAQWQRLPDSWTVNLTVVELTDQLNNIALPFNSGNTNTCSYADSDVAAVRALLHADGLAGWRVTLRAQDGGQLSSGCQSVFVGNVSGNGHMVTLLQASPQSATTTAVAPATRAASSTGTATGATQPAGGTSTLGSTSTAAATPTTGTAYQQAMMSHAKLAYSQLEQLYASVNAKLAAGCESVAEATGVWTQAASADGFAPTTLAFWRQANAHQPDPETFFRHYALYQQPASQHTGSCAHVLVMDVGGSGLANVYVARIAP